MAQYNVVEKFVSINGEGTRAGELAVFIRFQGCNLNCSYCDTKWANQKETAYTVMSEDEIYQYTKETGVVNVTLTGGEPLLQENMLVLLQKLAADSAFHVEIETNGSINLSKFKKISNAVTFTMDYKLPGSGMEANMFLKNFLLLGKKDTVKFVAGSMEDLERARKIVEKFGLLGRCHIYISTVFGKLDPTDVVEYMKAHNLNGVTLQLQMHKFIWNPQERGV